MYAYIFLFHTYLLSLSFSISLVLTVRAADNRVKERRRQSLHPLRKSLRILRPASLSPPAGATGECWQQDGSSSNGASSRGC